MYVTNAQKVSLLTLDSTIVIIARCHFCEKCTEELNGETGLRKLVHQEHNLIYFRTRNTKCLSNLEVSYLGKNLFTKVAEENLDPIQPMRCNGCKTMVKLYDKIRIDNIIRNIK